MKKFKSNKYKYYLSIIATFLYTAMSYAQDPQDPPPFEGNVTDLVPLDGGLSILIGAGIALGAKKAYQYSKEKKG